MNKRINQEEIARRLGLSQSTVSIALKGDIRVAQKTRDAVAQMAEEMGYVPDPLLSALSVYRKEVKSEKIEAAMAWVTNFPTKDGWSKTIMMRTLRRGAQECAEKLGYKLYDFWLKEPEISPRRLKQILLARGIRGLILPPQEVEGTKIDFDFSEFAAVSIGYSLKDPVLHIVSTHQLRVVRLAYTSLRERGYERIGMVLNREVDVRVGGAFSGGFLSMNPELKGEGFVPPFFYDDEVFDDEVFEGWFMEFMPDVILVTGHSGMKLKEWAKKKALVVGKDLALVELNYLEEDGSLAGVSQKVETLGRTAVSLLETQLSQFGFGVPEEPIRALIGGVWVDGPSAPPKNGFAVGSVP